MTTATIDLEDIRSYRINMRSRSTEAANAPNYPRIFVDFELTAPNDLYHFISSPIDWRHNSAEEEIALGPACWMWDYLRRSGQGGFFLPLSGGVDSSSTATIVHSMCHMVCDAIRLGDSQVLADVRRIIADPSYVPENPAALCKRLLVTCYMGSENSSVKTRKLASTLASQLGCDHLEINIDSAISAVLGIFRMATGLKPEFRTNGGCARQNLALQNIQARIRMVLSYLFAQLMLWCRNRPGGLLVLGSANVDESLRGYMTKYDCSSADINPIGGISKTDLRLFLRYAMEKYNVPVIQDIIESPPTAELEPLENGKIAQTDEQDMGMTYDELSQFGRLRKQQHCGPFSMFCRLVSTWRDSHTPQEVSNKVKHFFRCYAIHRHKMTVLTPSCHAESYGPDDNRFDHRPFLYRANWSWQFKRIDKEVCAWLLNQIQNSDIQINIHCSFQISTLTTIGANNSQNDASYLATNKNHDDHSNSLPRHPKISSSSLSFAGGSQDVSASSSKRPSLKSHNNVMGKIKDRTGIPV